MKAGFFLALFELCAKMCLSSVTAGISVVETPQRFLPNLWPFNKTAQQKLHTNVPEPSGEEFMPAFSMCNFTEKNADFGFNLYRKIALKDDNNVFLSPLSLSFSLAAFMLASKGETHNQIVQSLNLPLSRTKENLLPELFQRLRGNITRNEEFLLLQNSFSFIQKDFQIKEIFSNLSKQYFGMDFLSVDFRNSTLTKNIINQHIKGKTRGKISKLFDTFDPHAKIIQVNYVLFKGNCNYYPGYYFLNERSGVKLGDALPIQLPLGIKRAAPFSYCACSESAPRHASVSDTFE